MKRLSIALLGLGLTVLPLNPVWSQESPSKPDLAQTHQDINIMRRVFVKSIDRALGDHLGSDEEKSASEEKSTMEVGLLPATSGPIGYSYAFDTYSGLFSNYANDARGFYVPGHGAMFSLGVNVPTIEVELVEGGNVVEKEDENDLWSEAEREATGKTIVATGTNLYFPFAKNVTKKYIIDEESVEVAVAAVVKAIGKHGLKIEGVVDDESIVVVLSVRGGQVLPKDKNMTQSSFYTVLGRSSSRDDTRRIVIEITISDLKRYAGERIDFDAIMERAKITRF
ncbi:MAG: hypothetical protein O7G85_12930 [Planctomycetota bacterium]|nr:hypothetical protein [Planctomycetota bacterium]